MNSKFKNRTNKFIWSIASMIQYINLFTKKNYEVPKNHIKLTVARDNFKEIQKSNELIDHTNDYLSLNDALSLNGQEINLRESNKNAYIKIHEGSFNDVPSSSYIGNAKSIKFNTSIKLLNYTGEIRKSIIFYTNNKRFKTVVLDNKVFKENDISIFSEVPVPKGAEHYRIVILFKTNEDGQCKLNYSYARINY